MDGRITHPRMAQMAIDGPLAHIADAATATTTQSLSLCNSGAPRRQSLGLDSCWFGGDSGASFCRVLEKQDMPQSAGVGIWKLGKGPPCRSEPAYGP